MTLKNNLETTYNPKNFEERIYKMWEESGYFKADVNSQKEPYTIVIPPPSGYFNQIQTTCRF